MTEKQIINQSKFLSLVLRHKPQTIGIELDKNGWVSVDILIKKINEFGKPLTLENLETIVEKKQ